MLYRPLFRTLSHCLVSLCPFPAALLFAQLLVLFDRIIYFIHRTPRPDILGQPRYKYCFAHFASASLFQQMPGLCFPCIKLFGTDAAALHSGIDCFVYPGHKKTKQEIDTLYQSPVPNLELFTSV